MERVKRYILFPLIFAMILMSAGCAATESTDSMTAYARILSDAVDQDRTATIETAQAGGAEAVPGASDSAVYDEHGTLAASLSGSSPESVRETVSYARLMGHMESICELALTSSGKPGVAVLTKIPVSGAEKPMSGIVRAVFELPADEQNTGILYLADDTFHVANLTEGTLFSLKETQDSPGTLRAMIASLNSGRDIAARGSVSFVENGTTRTGTFYGLEGLNWVLVRCSR